MKNVIANSQIRAKCHPERRAMMVGHVVLECCRACYEDAMRHPESQFRGEAWGDEWDPYRRDESCRT